MRDLLRPVALAIGVLVSTASCGDQGNSRNQVGPSPTAEAAPSLTTGQSPALFSNNSFSEPANSSRPAATFPPRNEPVDFGNQLNALYRDTLRRPAVSAFVDLEGWVVWIQEYLRYRAGECAHVDAVSRVFSQIRGGGVLPVCGQSSAPFPPRDQSVDFGAQLNTFYRDGLGRGAVTTFVDLEGWIVWIQEYLRYRVNDCSHSEAVSRVFAQISGGGIQPVCTPVAPNTPGLIIVRGGPSACTCWRGTITVLVDFPAIATGTLTCSSSVAIVVPPGSHFLRAADADGFISRTVTVPPGGAVTIDLGCT